MASFPESPDAAVPHAQILAALLMHAPVGIILGDGAGKLTDINPRAVSMFGLSSPSEVLGRPVWEVLADDAEKERETLLAGLREAEPQHTRFTCKTHLGKDLDCEVSFVPFPSDSGKAGGFAVFFEDASQRTALFENLLRAEKLSAVGEVAAGVAHEINNPLTGILGNAQLLLAKTSDEYSQKRLDQIVQGVQRCHKIVQGLMGFAAKGRTEKSFEDVNELFKDTLSLRAYQMRVDSIEIETHLAPDLPQIQVVGHELRSVFLNIINNAHQALLEVEGRQRRLRVRTGIRDSMIFVEVEDNGPGIPVENQSKVFDPFFTTRPVDQGTGLGLSIAFGVVRDHHGEIQLESKAGAGATFTVLLPAVQPRGKRTPRLPGSRW